MSSLILFLAFIIILCLLFGRISNRLGVPVLLAFILLGMLFGSDGIFKIPFENYDFAEKACSISLIFIMFYGGFGTNTRSARPIFGKAALLSSLGVVITAALTGLFCTYVLGFSFLEGMLVGSVICSTDAASVFSILRSKRLNLKYNTAPLLEVESGSNDPFSYMLTVLVLTVMGGGSGGSIVGMLVLQIIFGVIVGVAVALLAEFAMTRVKFQSEGFEPIFIFAMALVSYALADVIGGNGYLSVYLTGIVLGSRPIPGKKELAHFFDGLTGLVQILIFFLLGLLATPSMLPEIVFPALFIALFLTFIARPAAVFAILSPFKCPVNQQLLVSWSGLRGAASIVFAIMAMVHPAYNGSSIFHIVFFIVLFSIALQGSLIPLVAKKLDMIDDNADVMKTFNDYSNESPVQFIKIHIEQSHAWSGCLIRDVELPPGLLLALIIRDGAQLVPRGETAILPGDTAVLSGPSLGGEPVGALTEVIADKDSDWPGKTLSQIKLEPNRLILLIKRGSRVIVPSGSTQINENDILIISEQ